MSHTTIYKYTLPLTDRPNVEMPQGAAILTVQMQYAAITVWAQVNSDRAHPSATRHFAIVGTGRPLPKDGSYQMYVGTVQMAAGDLVWHVYDLGESE